MFGIASLRMQPLRKLLLGLQRGGARPGVKQDCEDDFLVSPDPVMLEPLQRLEYLLPTAAPTEWFLCATDATPNLLSIFSSIAVSNANQRFPARADKIFIGFLRCASW